MRYISGATKIPPKQEQALQIAEGQRCTHILRVSFSNTGERSAPIVDRLFAAAELRLGTKPQRIVRITRTDAKTRSVRKIRRVFDER